MRTVTVAEVLPATVHQAESCWYDTRGWPSWVDGLEQVEDTTAPWPAVGATVSWRSGPAGRGSVVERVSAYEPLDGMTVDVRDGSIDGRQSVAFTPVEDGVEVRLTLSYEIRDRNPFTPLVDLLFIRRAMETSLRATLSGFGAELAHRRRGAG